MESINGYDLSAQERKEAESHVGSHVFNPFLFIKNKRLFISSEGFSILEKNTLICYQRAMLPIHLGVTALCR
jgi:hypothetical protein